MIERVDKLRFAQVEQDDRLLNADDHEWLIVAVKYQHLALKGAMAGMEFVVEKILCEGMVWQTEKGRRTIIGFGVSRVDVSFAAKMMIGFAIRPPIVARTGIAFMR